MYYDNIFKVIKVMEISQDKINNILVHDENNVKGFFGPYRFLSNYHPSAIEYEGLLYASTEAAYQAAKSTDDEVRKQFLGLAPNAAKKLGQKIQMREDWNSVKDEVMYQVIKFKFENNRILRKKLLDTEEKYLEETNYWNDTYWGVCEGKGQNQLGITLMRIRKELKESF
jgi:ribA/ribD-fused uncharacterized protein